MDVTVTATAAADTRVDLLVVAAARVWKRNEVMRLDQRLKGQLIPELTRQGFGGAAGDVALFQTHGALPARHVVLCGIEATPGPENWYKLADTVVGRARELKASSAAVALPAEVASQSAWATLAEGLELSSYTFERLKSAKPRRPRLQRVQLLSRDDDTATQRAIRQAQLAARATWYARDLINLPAATVTPAYLAAEAKRIARAQRLRVRVLHPSALKRAGMGALLGVAQGSAQAPCFIELVYQPAGRPRRRVALAGKGITFDSGGLSLKTADSMQSQKRDMAGGAAVLAVMSVVRDLGIPVEVRAYVPATENMPGGRALKPGDVVRAYNGKTIEVLNTDAEGRLVLADALSYAAAAKPDVLIDLATLTAAVRSALGSRYAGIMGTDAGLVQALIGAGRECGENLWELPLVAAYRSDLDSLVADMKNVGDGGAGTIVAALFLREFVGNVSWAHIDFSSTVVTDKPFAGHPRGASGFGVRTLLRYLLRPA